MSTASQLPELKLKAIGFVRNGINRGSARQKWEDVISEIVINPDLQDALDNLDEFSHIIVIFWTQRKSADLLPHKIHVKHNPDLPLVGLFATRSPDRPNPLAKTTVRLLGRQGNILRVQGLDAFNDTIVIDIKPYLPDYDSAEGAKVPGWIKISP